LIIPDDLKVILATKNETFDFALTSPGEWIFDLSPNISSLEKRAELTHSFGKKYFIHFDLADGLGKDKSGIVYAREQGIDGIISTRVNIIKMAREAGLFTVQRFFIVDSHSVDTTLEGIKSAKPDMIEVMPGVVCKVIKRLAQSISLPIIAGGLIESAEDAEAAYSSGARAVSTSNRELWSI